MSITIANPYTNAKVIEACRAKERWAQKEIYEYYYPKMFGTSLRYSKNRDGAQDILHESFIKVFNNFQDFKPDSNLEAWIRRIVINTAIDHFRRNKVRRTEDLNGVPPIRTPQPGAESQATEREILVCIQALSPQLRTVFNLYVMEGYSHKEVAQLLGIKASTSRSSLVKARAQLREMLAKKGIYHE
jgi:RNA polymerase sigma-70 factor (ECF subfamily)